MATRLWAVIAAAVVVVLAAAAGLYLWTRPSAPPPPAVAPAAPPAPAPAPAPLAQFPVPGAEAPADALQAPVVPPQELAASFARGLGALVDPAAAARFIGADDLVRRVVATVDNLAGDELPMRVRAVLATPGTFAVRADGDGFVIDPANARRYEPLVRFVESIDTRAAVALYAAHYRLFQGEYRGQGGPGRYFNDRLIAAIDHLLATPRVDGPIRLVQPRVLYRFADPALESLSAGQKAMLRLGPQNGDRLKAKLRALRAELVRSPGAAASSR